MKTQQLTTQDRFTLALNATWSVLRDPVLTKIYMRQWKRYLSRGVVIKKAAPYGVLLGRDGEYNSIIEILCHQ